MEKWTKEELDELLLKAKEKAKTDQEFSKELQSDVKAALVKLSGRTLPDGFTLKVIAAEELSDDAVDRVAGGKKSDIVCDAYSCMSDQLGCPAESCAINLCHGVLYEEEDLWTIGIGDPPEWFVCAANIGFPCGANTGLPLPCIAKA